MYHLADVVYRAEPRSLPFSLSISRTGMELHWKMPIITVSPDEEFLILHPFLQLLLPLSKALDCHLRKIQTNPNKAKSCRTESDTIRKFKLRAVRAVKLWGIYFHKPLLNHLITRLFVEQPLALPGSAKK